MRRNPQNSLLELSPRTWATRAWLFRGGPNHRRLTSSLCLMAVRGSCLFYSFCCSAVSRWSRSSASNRICCVNDRNSYKAQVSHQMLFDNMLKSFKITFLTKRGVKILYIVCLSSISLIKEWVPLVYLDEPVSPLQVVHQFLLLCLPVLPAV